MRFLVLGAAAIVGDMLRRARGFGVATLLRAAWCHLQVYENCLARKP